MKKNTFVVLRKPGPDLVDRSGGARTAGKSRRYCGIDRQEWDRFDEAHYAKTLPDALEQSWMLLDSNRHKLGFRFASYGMAEAIAEFSADSNSAHEICAVQVLDSYDDDPPSSNEGAIEWFGIDIFVDGYGSAILQGVFARPDLFTGFQSTLNTFGLFDFHEPRITEYQKAVIENGRVSGSAIEVMPDIDELWHAIAVGRRRSR